MSLVFRIECTGQAANREQAIIALGGGDGAHLRPLQNRIRLDELLRPLFGKISKTVEHVGLDLVLEPHSSGRVRCDD